MFKIRDFKRASDGMGWSSLTFFTCGFSLLSYGFCKVRPHGRGGVDGFRGLEGSSVVFFWFIRPGSHVDPSDFVGVVFVEGRSL